MCARGDCDDDPAQDDAAPASLTYPRAAGEDPVDAPRDGWDADCAGDDDYDGDVDGFVSDDNVGLPTEDGYGNIEGTGGLPGGDCNDDDDAVNPEGVEALTSTDDRDCDGDPRTFLLEPLADASSQLYELAWTEPSDLVFDANTTEVWLSIRAPEVTITRDSASGPLTPTTYYENAFAFGSNRNDPAGGLVGLADWWRYTGGPAPYSLTPGHDFVAEDGVLYGLIGLQLSTGRALRLIGYDLSNGSRFGQSSRLLYAGSSALPDFSQLSLVRTDAGVLHAVGCEAASGILHYVRSTETLLDSNSLEAAALYDSMPMTSCALSTDDRLLGRNGTSLETWSFDGGGLPPTFTLDSVDPTYAPLESRVLTDGSNSWTVLADFNSLELTVVAAVGGATALPTQGTPRSLHAALVHEATGVPDLVVAYTNTAGEAWFVRFDPDTATSEEFQLVLDDAAQDAAVFIDTEPTTGEEVVYAAVATAASVQYGWGEY